MACSKNTMCGIMSVVNWVLFYECPALRCWFTKRRWSQLRGQRSAGALAGNQLLPNVALKRDRKALVDLVDGLSSSKLGFFLAFNFLCNSGKH